MGTVLSTPFAQATSAGNQRKIDRCQDGTLFTTVANNQGAATYEAYSKDNGATWTGSGGITDPAGSGTTYASNPVAFTDESDYRHVVFKSPTNGYLYYSRGTPNAGRTAYTWSTAVQVGPSSAVYDHPDLVAFREGSGWSVQIVYGRTDSSTVKCVSARLTVSSTGSITVNDGGTSIGASLSAANANSAFPSIDFRHTGDGKTVASSTPDLYVGWSAGATGAGYGIRFRKASYSGGAWTWGTEREIDTTRYSTAQLATQCMFDGTRVVIAGSTVNTAGTIDVIVHDRDAADPASGGTTTRAVLSGLQGTNANYLNYGSSTYDSSGNIYLFGASGDGGNGTQKASSRRWTRATTTLEALTTFDTTSPTAPYISARRGPQGQAIDYVYTDGTASPYTVTSGRITLNTAPNAGGKPTPDGANLDRTVAQSFSYAFSDPDAGDQPSKTDWRWRTSPVSGTPGSWNTSTVTGNSTSITYAANTFPAGRVELQVLPYDAQGVVAPAWSDSAFDTAANPPTAPTFSSPAAGSTIATSSVTATIVADTLDAHQWRVMGDTSGSANTTVVNAGATIEDPTSRTFTVTGLANAQTVHLQDRRRVGGIWSPWADNGAQAVSYTPPPPATIVLTPLPATAKLSVAWTIPAPTGSEPAVSTVDVYVDDGTAEGLRRIAGTGAVDRAPGASPWVHDTPALLREYGNGTGRVVIVVKGANGTTRTTAS